MGLRFDPIGGGQFKQAVQQIIEAESQPIKNLEKRKTREDTRLKLFQEFKTKFSALDKAIGEISTFRKLRELKVDLGDGANLMSVTVDKERAEPGQYNIEIDQLAGRTSCISNGFENPDEAVFGTGFVTMSLPDGDTTEIYIEDKYSSLRGIAALINKEAKSPIRASVIKDASDTDTPWRMLLTAKKDGAANQLEFPEFYFMDGSEDFYIDDDKEAQNAIIVMDGFEIEQESNDVTDFLPGVNIHLKQAKSDQPFTLTITEDYQKIAGKVKGLVDQVNQVLQFIVKQNAVDAHSDTSTTFAGDSSLQSLEYAIRNVMHQSYTAGDPDTEEPQRIFLNELGIEFEKTGQVAFKEEKFTKYIEKNFDQIAQAISGPVGFATRLRGVFDTYSRVGNGILTTKENGLRQRIKSIDDQIDRKNQLLDRRKQDLVGQFSRLEASLGNLQRQQQYLSAAMPGSGGSNPISQLLG